MELTVENGGEEVNVEAGGGEWLDELRCEISKCVWDYRSYKIAATR